MKKFTQILLLLFISSININAQNYYTIVGEDDGFPPLFVLRFEVVDSDSHTPINGAQVRIKDKETGRQILLRTDYSGVGIVIVFDIYRFPYSGTINVTANYYEYWNDEFERYYYYKKSDNYPLYIVGMEYNWSSTDRPTVQEIIQSLKYGDYTINNYYAGGPGCFEYSIDLNKIYTNNDNYYKHPDNDQVSFANSIWKMTNEYNRTFYVKLNMDGTCSIKRTYEEKWDINYDFKWRISGVSLFLDDGIEEAKFTKKKYNDNLMEGRTSEGMVIMEKMPVNKGILNDTRDGKTDYSKSSNQVFNVALSSNGGKATASSYGSYSGYNATPNKAIDGNTETSWHGTSVPDWYIVEFDKEYKVEKIGLYISYHTQTINVELSSNGKNWEKVVYSHKSKDTQRSGQDDSEYKRFEIKPTYAKYIRVNFTYTDAPYSHIYQCGLKELEVYAKD